MRNLTFFVAFLLVPMSFALADVPETERDALEALFISANGAGWTQNSGWEICPPPPHSCIPVCESGPVSNWENVYCEHVGPGVDDMTVVKLQMNEINLTGFIPPEIWDLSNLQFLYLNQNQLGGVIPVPTPAQYAQLQDLQSLYLFTNQLSGIIPPELGNLLGMKKLLLHENNLIGHIPVELANLSELEWLNLFDNQLTGPIPPGLGDLANLVKLQLHNNQLSGNIPVTFDATMSSLQWLYLNNNRLSGPIPPGLGELLSLLKLRLYGNKLSGSIPSTLGDLSNLNELDLHNNQLNGDIPPTLGSLHPFRMKWIYLQNNYLSGIIPPELGNLEFMLWLDLSNNRLSGTIPWELSLIQALTKLYLNSNNLSGDIPQELEVRKDTLEKALGLDIRWNALHTHDENFIVDFLNEYQVGLDAISSQTIPPENDGVPPPTPPGRLEVAWVGAQSVGLEWSELDPTPFNPDPPPPSPGGYEVFSSLVGPDGPWISGGRISGWVGVVIPPAPDPVVQMPVTGLAESTDYWFKVGTYTNPHPANTKNTVTSDLGVAVWETRITGAGCTAPVISIVWNGPVATLSVPNIYDTYEWGSVTPPSGLGTTNTIDVSPGALQDFWVTITTISPPCKEAALIHVDPGLFADGFESGDTSLWSTSVP
jgi:Leucine-rich repeat (LRR) protein